MNVEEKYSFTRTLLMALQGLKFTISMFTDKITSVIEKLHGCQRRIYDYVKHNLVEFNSG